MTIVKEAKDHNDNTTTHYSVPQHRTAQHATPHRTRSTHKQHTTQRHPSASSANCHELCVGMLSARSEQFVNPRPFSIPTYPES